MKGGIQITVVGSCDAYNLIINKYELLMAFTLTHTLLSDIQQQSASLLPSHLI
jgi:hypothetical protein